MVTCASTSGQRLDSIKVADLLKSAKEKMNQNADSGLLYLDSIKPILINEDHNLYQKADYHKALGIWLYRKSLYDSSSFHYEKALETFEKGGYELDIAKIAVNLSINYNRLGRFEETIESATKALKMFEKLSDRKGISVASNIIGQVYFYNDDYTKAKQYFNRYLQNALDAQDSTEIAGGFSNLGAVFSKLERFDSAIFYNQRALEIHQKLGNQYGIGNAHQNLGMNYLSRSMPDSAIFFYQQALPFYQTTENKSGQAEVLVNLGKCHFSIGDFQNAIDFSIKGQQIAQSINEPVLIQESSLVLSESYESIGDFRRALSAYKQYDSLSQEIFNEETRNNIEEINVRYETEKKEQQIALQTALLSEKEAQNERNIAMIIGLVIVIVSLVLVVMLNRSRSRKKQQLLLQEAQTILREAEIEAAISSQEKERSRFAKDLHDGFGQMISILNLNLKSLEDGAKDKQEVFENSTKVLEEMYQELKSICFNLMPQTLIKHGITAALNEFAARIKSTDKLFVETDFFGLEERLTEVQEISLYRITQEWVNNVMKYSDARKVTIQVTRDEDEITLMIEDDGAGFDLDLLRMGKGNGWKNMNSRANLINGELEVDTTLGVAGSTLIVNAKVFAQESRQELV